MKRVLWAMLLALAVGTLAGRVAAQTPPQVEVRVIDAAGNTAIVPELGCATWYTGAPDSFLVDDMQVCTSCSTLTCTWVSLSLHLGGYIPTTHLSTITANPAANSYEAVNAHGTALLWSDPPWQETRVITFVLDYITVIPGATPLPTLAPIPTLEPPSSVDVSDGFGSGFGDAYGQLSGKGILPDFGLDASQWLFAARKVIQFINQGNLLYVLGGFLLAITVINWAIKRVQNPR